MVHVQQISPKINTNIFAANKQQDRRTFLGAAPNDSYQFSHRTAQNNVSFKAVKVINEIWSNPSNLLGTFIRGNTPSDMLFTQFLRYVNRTIDEFKSAGLDLFIPESQRVTEEIKNGVIVLKEHLASKGVRITKFSLDAKGLTRKPKGQKYVINTAIYSDKTDKHPVVMLSGDKKTFMLSTPDQEVRLIGKYRGDCILKLDGYHVKNIKNGRLVMLRNGANGKKVLDTSLRVTDGDTQRIIKRINPLTDPMGDFINFSKYREDINGFLDGNKKTIDALETAGTSLSKEKAENMRKFLSEITEYFERYAELNYKH